MLKGLRESEFKQIREYIYERSGLFFDDNKKGYLEKRLIARMNQLEIQTFAEYFYKLKFNEGDEFSRLMELITTNETYFFRNIPQLNTFSYHILPELLNRKADSGDFRLRIWSAGCSSGEEPYTIAIILKERIAYIEDWDVEIYGTDISYRVLKLAQVGEYHPRSLMDTDENIIRKYFTYDTLNNKYKISDEIIEMVRFKHLNLYDEEQVTRFKNFDIIFCRNVLIYFDESSRKKVVEMFYDSLVPGGYIMLGYSESMLRITKAFEMLRMGSDITYRKPFNHEKGRCCLNG
ncbi:MAG: protein-glutamate O-methyltransferase CheR [Firmicutes bacterium]|jgi:chemotaxis protein methyltransferase CheR|nr:protein-glutamate O-methyltransferase CheR [Bacillota bacterium]